MSNTSSFSSSDHVDQYIKKFVDKLISETWDLKNFREEICYSRNSFTEVQRDVLSSKRIKMFVILHSKFIFDIIILDFVRWTVKKEILKLLNCDMSDDEKVTLINNLAETGDEYLFKLVDVLTIYGDYDFQVMLVKVILTIFTRSTIKPNIQGLIPESKELQKKFLNISIENFDIPVRDFLNCLNEKSKKVLSVNCCSISLGQIDCVLPKSKNHGVWIDFNTVDNVVSWYADKRIFGSQEFDFEEQDDTILFTIFPNDIAQVIVERPHYKPICVTFELKQSSLVFPEQYQPIIDKEKTLKVLLDNSPSAEKLLSKILPIFNKKSVLKDRDVNIPTKESNIYVKSSKPFSAVDIEEIDFDDMEICFKSSEQLLKMASTFDNITHLMNKYVSSAESKKNQKLESRRKMKENLPSTTRKSLFTSNISSVANSSNVNKNSKTTLSKNQDSNLDLVSVQSRTRDQSIVDKSKLDERIKNKDNSETCHESNVKPSQTFRKRHASENSYDKIAVASKGSNQVPSSSTLSKQKNKTLVPKKEKLKCSLKSTSENNTQNKKTLAKSLHINETKIMGKIRNKTLNTSFFKPRKTLGDVNSKFTALLESFREEQAHGNTLQQELEKLKVSREPTVSERNKKPKNQPRKTLKRRYTVRDILEESEVEASFNLNAPDQAGTPPPVHDKKRQSFSTRVAKLGKHREFEKDNFFNSECPSVQAPATVQFTDDIDVPICLASQKNDDAKIQEEESEKLDTGSSACSPLLFRRTEKLMVPHKSKASERNKKPKNQPRKTLKRGYTIRDKLNKTEVEASVNLIAPDQAGTPPLVHDKKRESFSTRVVKLWIPKEIDEDNLFDSLCPTVQVSAAAQFTSNKDGPMCLASQKNNDAKIQKDKSKKVVTISSASGSSIIEPAKKSQRILYSSDDLDRGNLEGAKVTVKATVVEHQQSSLQSDSLCPTVQVSAAAQLTGNKDGPICLASQKNNDAKIQTDKSKKVVTISSPSSSPIIEPAKKPQIIKDSSSIEGSSDDLDRGNLEVTVKTTVVEQQQTSSKQSDSLCPTVQVSATAQLTGNKDGPTCLASPKNNDAKIQKVKIKKVDIISSASGSSINEPAKKPQRIVYSSSIEGSSDDVDRGNLEGAKATVKATVVEQQQSSSKQSEMPGSLNPKLLSVSKHLEEQSIVHKNGTDDQKVNIFAGDKEPDILPSWSTTALVTTTKVITVQSSDYFGKYLLILCYHFDISLFQPKYYSEIKHLNNEIDTFNEMNTSVLFCTKGPNTDVADWMKRIDNPHLLRSLSFPLIIDKEGKYMTSNLKICSKDCGCDIKTVLLYGDKGILKYRDSFPLYQVLNAEFFIQLVRKIKAIPSTFI